MHDVIVQTNLDLARLEAGAHHYGIEFDSAAPAARLLVDGFLTWTPGASEFPTAEWNGWSADTEANRTQTLRCNDVSVMPSCLANLVRELAEPRFLRVLERITGVAQLIPDPYLTDGGLRLVGPGGDEAPHTDGHYFRALNLYRRVNVELFMDDWAEADGGALTFFAAHGAMSPIEAITPRFGRMVIYRSNDEVVHGFSGPVAPGRWRRSVTASYFTSAESDVFSGGESGRWFQRGEDAELGRGARLAAFRTLTNVSRGLSIMAHAANPNQGAAQTTTVLRQMRREQARLS